jgi:hypothetical protein
VTSGPLDLLDRVVAILDALDIPYALGGSLASSLVGEPRATADVDVAVRLDDESAPALLERLGAEFYLPTEDARAAVRQRSSFNVVDTASALKVDLFVVGPDLLDRMQIERRARIAIPGHPSPIWVTSAEDQVLRKLDWYRSTGESSDRQMRDVVGILRAQRDQLDLGYLRGIAERTGLSALLEAALEDATS